ncbi:hydrogenase maturation protease [Flavihumibacter stibioxidans]|uniref:Hydrogenase maturation protease n=1 Tax=Flavihumibacter stibioxidans TaxID=1834163 RepID=A0ABR7M721_9BACT|nr:HyaD/HybD family hydrogenase maturation endopeptidase [Flavihumibacter stibioxidans]MBC6490819.1 hydrogenase maturation protease [Flavihumibacter stibioxidans]
MKAAHSILVLGIGNYLMADEGVGVHIAEALSMETLPPGVDVLDGGTGGFHLLEYLQSYSTIIMIDATLDNKPPGTIRLIKPRFAADFPRAMSTHDIGLKDLVGALQLLGSAPDIQLYVISIPSIQEQGVELTPIIKRKIPALLDLIRQHIHRILVDNNAVPVIA